MSELEVVDEKAEYMAYCCAARGNRETTIIGKLVAFHFFREQWVGRSLLIAAASPLPEEGIKKAPVKEGIKRAPVKEGIKRAPVKGVTQKQVGKPLSWEMLKRIEKATKECRAG